MRHAPGVTGVFDVIALVPLADVPANAVESLLDRAFGANRRGRTAYRVRAGTRPIAALSFAAIDESGELLGTIQCWPVELAADDGQRVPMVMVGPVAVDPGRQQEGIGRALMARMLEAAAEGEDPGADSLMLVGDPEYYARFFGFTAALTSGWRLPGPFEARRLLARGPRVPAAAGMIGPRVLAAAA